MDIPKVQVKFILGESDTSMGEALEAADAAYKEWIKAMGDGVAVIRTQHAHSQSAIEAADRRLLGGRYTPILAFSFTIQVDYALNGEVSSKRTGLGFGIAGE
jgi:hypothetical protein